MPKGPYIQNRAGQKEEPWSGTKKSAGELSASAGNSKRRFFEAVFLMHARRFRCEA